MKIKVKMENAFEAIDSVLPNVPIEDLIFACIGTDRSTGDSLGPLVGTFLKAEGFNVYGTIDEPLHAMNLQCVLNKLPNDKIIIAVDACLGKVSSVGTIDVFDGPIFPGAGVDKRLPPVGNYGISGIVNTSGFMEYFVLQNTRLSFVMKMAQYIVDGLVKKYKHKNHEKCKVDLVAVSKEGY